MTQSEGKPEAVQQSTEVADDDRFEFRAELLRRRVLPVNISTAKRHEAGDPSWPRPYLIGSKVAYKWRDVKSYLESRQVRASVGVRLPRLTPKGSDSQQAPVDFREA